MSGSEGDLRSRIGIVVRGEGERGEESGMAEKLTLCADISKKRAVQIDSGGGVNYLS